MRDGNGRMRGDWRGRCSMAWRLHFNAGIKVAGTVASGP